MVHPNTPLADLETVCAWAMSHQRSLYVDAWAEDAKARSSITTQMETTRMSTLLTYREDTGRGISEEALRTLGFPPGEWNELRSNVVTTEFDAQIGRSQLADLNRSALNNGSPAMLNKLMPEMLRITSRYNIPLPPDSVANWRDAIEKMEHLGEIALQLAGGARPVRDDQLIENCSLDDVIHARSARLLALWGNAAIEAAHYSCADMLLALGLEDLVDDALVRARDLARR